MAYLIPSKSKNPSWKTTIPIIFLIVLLFGSCTATRPGKKMMMMEVRSKEWTKMENRELQPGKPVMGFEYKGQVFSFFPKGTPVPPSGPSKRHNSSPQN